MKHKLPSIPDFNPVKRIDFKSNKPIYYNVNREVRFDEDGQFRATNKIIWKDSDKYKDAIRGCWVSPDAAYILVFQRKRLHILSCEGHLLDTIKNVVFFDRHTIKDQFEFSSIQWSKDSRHFYLLKYDYHTDNYQKRYHNKNSLYRYSIRNKQIEKVIDFGMEVCSWDYHLTRDEQSIIFRLALTRRLYRIALVPGRNYSVSVRQVTGTGSSLFFDIDTGEKNIRPVEDITILFPQLFINFQSSDFLSSDVMEQSYDLQTIAYCDWEGLYLSKNYEITRLFQINTDMDSIDPKMSTDINLSASFFLPGNRYIIINCVNAQEYKGGLVIDTLTSSYMPLHCKLHCYFSITSDDCPALCDDFRVRPFTDSSLFKSTRLIQEGNELKHVKAELPKPNLRDALAEYLAEQRQQ